MIWYEATTNEKRKPTRGFRPYTPASISVVFAVALCFYILKYVPVKHTYSNDLRAFERFRDIIHSIEHHIHIHILQNVCLAYDIYYI